MAKMFLSLGFWMTIVLFVALGYVFGAECPGSMNCGDGQSAIAASNIQDENRSFESDPPASDLISRGGCATDAPIRGNISDFPQIADLEAGGPTYLPGLSLTISHRPPQVSLCPGAIAVPRY